MIEIKEITEGKRDGEYVWICDFRYNHYGEKPIRHIKPIKVLIRNNSETSRRIYYSNSHFVGLNKKNLPIFSKIIPPFDNTGYRMCAGTPLNCFENEKECVSFYKNQIKKAIKGLSTYKEHIVSTFDKKIDELIIEISNG